jgi:hypothetical protein
VFVKSYGACFVKLFDLSLVQHLTKFGFFLNKFSYLKEDVNRLERFINSVHLKGIGKSFL